ncbi:MAG: hypothetical protein D3904_14465, partial [Candidatus Electrothrix sp. EH2]|nr:hypothetical protein [Candidatus Electrothrix sp. EH2]
SVRHPFFGIGTVKDIPAPRRIEVSFDQHGDKLLHLDYAKLEVLDREIRLKSFRACRRSAAQYITVR